jgi:carotenoid cleavage dioxygenase-like enzyme
VVSDTRALSSFSARSLTNVKRDAHTARCILKQVIYDGTIELPRINPSYHMKPYTYAYGVSAREHGHLFDRLIKVNVRTGERLFWDVEGHFPAEPIFLAAPEGHDEDDGVLLRYIAPFFVAFLHHHLKLGVRV